MVCFLGLTLQASTKWSVFLERVTNINSVGGCAMPLLLCFFFVFFLCLLCWDECYSEFCYHCVHVMTVNRLFRFSITYSLSVVCG